MINRKTLKFFLPALLLWFLCSCSGTRKDQAKGKGVIDNSQSPFTKLYSLPMQDTRLTEGFWAKRFDLADHKMIHTLEEAMLSDCSANLNRIKEAAGMAEPGQHGSPWGDGDNYKWIESMAHIYNITKEPELDAKMDEWIDIIGKAMEPDGYISTNIMHDESKRFDRVNAHEMYNMGHLLTAACIHYRVTGKENFLNLAKKNADFIYEQWQAEPVKMARFPWNPSVFMGMAEMYRTTRDPKYLEQLKIFINNRGSRPNPDRDHRYGGTDQTQDRIPLRKDTIAVGHAVTGTYFYCGAADLYAETGDEELLAVLERIWNDIHHYKIDIVCGVAMGGQDLEISPRGDEVHESFANERYTQPNGYNETCANIGTGMFNYRMFMLTGDPKYADWTERMMYNTLNSGVDIEGEHWFYCNPLSWDGQEGEMGKQSNGPDPNKLVPKHHSAERWRVMNCYCCPPSVTRTTAKIHNWFYNTADDGSLWVNFYGSNKLSTSLRNGTNIELSQTTNYPWDGIVNVKIEKVKRQILPIYFRIPEWVENPKVFVNNKEIKAEVKAGTYCKIEREWKAGDEVVLDFPMSVRLMEANPKVKNFNNKVAVMRGPVVYCLELPKEDNGEELFKQGIYLPENISLTAEYREDFLGGLTVLKGKALNEKEKERFVSEMQNKPKDKVSAEWNEEELYRPLQKTGNKVSTEGTVDIELIPYYAWANRGIAYMDVWIPITR